MPTYIYEFEETGETIEVEQKMSDKPHQYLLHPEKVKLMKVIRLVSTGVGVQFKGDGWTPPGNTNPNHNIKFPENINIDEKTLKNEEIVKKRSLPKKADESSPEKLRESMKFQNWLEKGGGIEALNKNAKNVTDIKK